MTLDELLKIYGEKRVVLFAQYGIGVINTEVIQNQTNEVKKQLVVELNKKSEDNVIGSSS